jgi:hypothetical protein
METWWVNKKVALSGFFVLRRRWGEYGKGRNE